MNPIGWMFDAILWIICAGCLVGVVICVVVLPICYLIGVVCPRPPARPEPDYVVYKVKK